MIYFVPGFDWGPGVTSSVPSAPSPPPEQKRRKGRVRFDLASGVAPQIYADGYYVGMLDDLNGELTLEPGPHTIELRADGFQPLELKVLVSADREITYRGALKPIVIAPAPVQEASAPPAPPSRATIYVIPGCYVGNVPPRDADLPVGCDVRLAVEFPPRQ